MPDDGLFIMLNNDKLVGYPYIISDVAELWILTHLHFIGSPVC